jgi:hypothetical protein
VNAAGDLPAQVAAVGAFLDPAPLRSIVAEMEIALTGCGAAEAADVAAAHGVTADLLRSAIAARNAFGKLSDLIHAAALALALPHLLKPGETLASNKIKARASGRP